MDTVSELRADYAGRIDRYPKDNPQGATARALHQTVVTSWKPNWRGLLALQIDGDGLTKVGAWQS